MLGAEAQKLFDHMPDATLLVDRQGVIRGANPATERVFGCTPSALVGERLDRLIPEGARSHHQSMVEGFFAAGRARAMGPGLELSAQRRDGSLFAAEIGLSFIDLGGQRHAICSVRDVSDRKAAERAVRLNEQWLSVTIESIGDAVIATDLEGQVVRMNRVAEMLTGYSNKEARQTPLASVFHIVDERTGDNAEDVVQRVLREGTIVALAKHTQLIARDGTRRAIADSAAPIRDADGRVHGVVLVFRDVTDERALRRLDAHCRSLVDHVSDAVIACDAELRCTAWNKAAEQLYGFTFAEVRGSSLDVLGTKVRGDLPQKIEAQLRAGEHVTAELEQTCKDGRKVQVVATVVMLNDEAGKPSGFLGVVRDLTASRAIEQRLVLAERLAAVGTLAAGVAHEINNPLAFVTANLGFVHQHLVEHATPETSDLASALADAIVGADRIAKIVKDIRTLGRTDDASGSVDVNAAVRAALSVTHNRVRHCGRVEECLQAKHLVHGNELRIVQVFTNLIVNSARALNQEKGAENIIRVGTRDDDGDEMVELCVEDNGEGIEESDLARVFDPFFTTKPVGHGTGLGLSICHRLVSAMGGTIQVDSERGMGTRVTIRLQRGVASAEVVDRPPEIVLAPRRMLVVDDEDLILKAIARMLPEWPVVLCRDAPQAIDRLVAGEAFDFVLCDAMMPALSGAQLYARLCEVRPDLARSVAFMTGGAFDQGVAAFLADKRVLQKPFTEDELRVFIRDCFSAGPLPARVGDDDSSS